MCLKTRKGYFWSLMVVSYRPDTVVVEIVEIRAREMSADLAVFFLLHNRTQNYNCGALRCICIRSRMAKKNSDANLRK